MGTGRARPRGRLAMIGLRLVMVAGLALVAISGSVGLTPGRARTEPASSTSPAPVAFGAPVAPHTGCAAGSSGPAELDLRRAYGGQVRVVRVHLPAGYRPDRPVPLLLNLHGSGSTAATQETQTELDATSDADDFIVAYPQGIRTSGAGYGWNIPGTPTFQPAGPDDVAFLTGLLGVLRHQFCVDPARVYASGFSGGARMVSQLACTPGVRLAGIAVAGGLRAPSPCHPAHPLAVLAFHGTADLSNPFNGHGQAYWTYSVPEAGSHNIWVFDDVMYMGYYNGGARVVDVSGELRGELYDQGREIAHFWSGDSKGFRTNLPFAWGAYPHNGVIYVDDVHSGLWAVKLGKAKAYSITTDPAK